VHLDLLQDGSFVTGLLAVFFFTFANISFYLVLTLYMQLGLGFSPLQSGTTVMPLAIAYVSHRRTARPATRYHCSGPGMRRAVHRLGDPRRRGCRRECSGSDRPW